MVSLADAEAAIELADAYGVCDGYPLSESQKITLRLAGGTREDGKWAATRVGDFGPRQGTGKNDKIAAWELAHILLFGTELIIHTAHEFPTANESFLRLVAVFEAWDDLRKKVARIRYANGEQGIELLNGQRLKYKARTGGSGRGFAKAGLLVYDEAQHLMLEHVAASGPAKLANPNSQTWYAGSGGLAASKVAWAMRRQAVLGTGGRLAYTEKTAERLVAEDGRVTAYPPSDVLDRDVWYDTIPGLGIWITEEGVEAQFDELAEKGPREMLCVWEPDESEVAELALPGWPVADATSTIVGDLAFAVEVSPDRQWSSIAAAGRNAAGQVHLEIIARLPGTARTAAWIAERRAKWAPIAVALDPAGPTGSLLPDLMQVGIEPVLVTAREIGQACGGLYDDVAEHRAVHRGEPDFDRALNEAVAAATKRRVGDSWVWDRRRSELDISALVAATLARYVFVRDEAQPKPEVFVPRRIR